MTEQKGNPIFIDSNVWLYAIAKQSDERKQAVAQQLIQQQSDIIVLSEQVINEVCVNLVKSKNISEDKIRALVNSFYKHYTVNELDECVFISASFLREKHSFSYYDSLIVASALEGNAEILYTEDMQHGLMVDERLTILNPFLTSNL